MLLILKKLIASESILEHSVGSVGNYVIFDNSSKDIVAGLSFREVPDDIKFPLSYRKDLENTIDVKFAGLQMPESFPIIAGPCSAENYEQIYSTAKNISEVGCSHFRAGCYKPRTNAYSFKGLEREGLKICRNVCDELGLSFVSEVKDLSNFDDVVEYTDVIQVGSKCMYDVGVLRELGSQNKAVLLKRHFGATLKEFAQAADFILSEGNSDVVLCERGIRTFEHSTRFSLDSSGIEWMKRFTRLPIIGDPSHAMGAAYGVSGLSLAMVAQGVNGLIIEVHPDPINAKSDKDQQLTFSEFNNLFNNILNLNKFMVKMHA